MQQKPQRRMPVAWRNGVPKSRAAPSVFLGQEEARMCLDVCVLPVFLFRVLYGTLCDYFRILNSAPSATWS